MNLFAPILRMAQVEGETTTTEPDGIQLLLPATAELIAGLIAFTIIFVFVWKWVLPMVDKRLEARQQAIVGQLTAAEETKREAEGILADYKAQLAKARDDANRIVEEARRTADALRSETMSKASDEASEITRKAREEAAGERERAASAIRDEVAALSMAVAEKAVAGAIDTKAQAKLVEQYIAELGALRP